MAASGEDRVEVRAGSTLRDSTFLGVASKPSMPSHPVVDRDHEGSVIGFFPEWGRASPLWGGELVDTLQLPDELVTQLQGWVRVWRAGFDELEGRWHTEAVGRAWIAEGDALLNLVRRYAAHVDIEVIPDPCFHEYATWERRP